MLELLYGDSGNRLTLMRVPIGPSDFATSVYTYDEVPGDYALEAFSVTHDQAYVLPMITRARSLAAASGREVKVLASPWTAPSWLKRNGAVRVRGVLDRILSVLLLSPHRPFTIFTRACSTRCSPFSTRTCPPVPR